MYDPEIKVKSLKKALEILNCFIEKQPLGVTEISEKLGLHKSSVHNVLNTLTALDYLDHDFGSGKYVLGVGVQKLGSAAGKRYNLQEIANSHMKTISDITNEIVHLSVPMNESVCYIDAAYPSSGVGYLASNLCGKTEPMYCTGSGKAMLSQLPEDFLEAYLSQSFVAKTENTITNPVKLRADIQATAARGYAIDNNEGIYGTSCIAMPILSKGKRLLGAMSISGPSDHFSMARIEQLAIVLKGHILQIESEI